MTATTTSDQAALPHWDLTPIFPALDSPEFAEAFARLVEDLVELDGLLTGEPQERYRFPDCA